MFQFSTITLLNSLTDKSGQSLFNKEDDTLLFKGEGLYQVDEDHLIEMFKNEGHKEYRDIVDITNLEEMISDPTKIYRIEFYIESNANADPLFSNSLSRKSKTVFVEFNSIDSFYINLNRFQTMTYGSQLLNLVGELDGEIADGKSTVTSANKTNQNNYLMASNCYIRVMNADVQQADDNGKFYSIGKLDIYHGSEGLGTQEDILKNYILPTGYNNRFCTITTKDQPLNGELYDMFIVKYVVNRGNLGVHAVGQQTISETTHCFFIKQSESEEFEDTITEFIEENTQKEEQNGITVKALRYDSDNDEFVETTYTLGEKIPIGSSASTNLLVLTEKQMNKLTIVSQTDDVATSIVEKPSYQWSSMFLEITEQVATSYGIDNSLIGNYLFTAIYSLANGLSKGTVNSAYYVYDGVEYEITCESAEPPVTPKVIATIDVVENPQKIVGILIDPETGDSTTVLPKSFEVDGILQPLDAIDTEVNLGYYTFETLGEHTITYELDNPTIIPASQFNQISMISVQLPVGITSIGNGAFIDGLFTNIEIPESITSIGIQAFSNCESLTSITINATTPPTLGKHAFDSTNNCPIYVPSESVQAYKTAWSDYANKIQAIS